MRTLQLVVVEPPRSALLSQLAATDGLAVRCSDYAGGPGACAGGADLAFVYTAQEEAVESLRCVRRIRAGHPRLPIVLVVEESSEQLAVGALHAGVNRYVQRAALDGSLAPLIDELTAEGVLPRQAAAHVTDLRGGDRLIGTSAVVCGLRAYLKKAARSNSNVLITGETGTGKDLVAQLIHQNSERSQRPFVSLNCTAIPESLFESELFGHERGAFTGAYASHAGRLPAATTGTVFFDEVGEMPLALQAKLLRALEEKQVHRLGGGKPVPLDIRVVAATNRDIEEAVQAGRFRSDLYYRLNVVRVELPPLRERLEDLPELLTYFVASFNSTFGTGVTGFTNDAVETLLAHGWPGNVRELKNVLESVFVNLADGAIGPVELPAEVRHMLTRLCGASAGERERLVRALVATNWNKSDAARRLSWSRMTLYRKMMRYSVSRTCTPAPARTVTSARKAVATLRTTK
jgi:DNA-binding NtrC family response regulator